MGLQILRTLLLLYYVGKFFVDLENGKSVVFEFVCICVMVVAIILGPRTAERRRNREHWARMGQKKCRQCLGLIHFKASICRHCRSRDPGDGSTIAP